MQEYDPAQQRLVGERHNVFMGTRAGLTEAPHIRKRDGWYYLLTAGGGTYYQHQATLARSRSLFGSYKVPGHLRLFGCDTIGSVFRQALVARRQQAFCYGARTVMEFEPRSIVVALRSSPPTRRRRRCLPCTRGAGRSDLTGARWGSHMQTITVKANGLRFEVLEEGAGDRLALCLHGFPEHAVSWRHQMPVLAAMGYRVWAVNQRGYGRTTRPVRVGDYAIPHLMADVAALMDASGARSTVLIGHDWGAMVAWCFAAGQVRPLERLVIMNVPHPLCFRAALRRPRQMLRSWYTAFFQVPVLPDRLLAAGNGAAVRRMFAGLALPPEVMATYTRQIAEPGAATAMLNWYRAARRPGPGMPDLARVIETPTMVVWGEDDVALDLICLEGTERYVRDLLIHRLPGVSHWVQQDAPDTVNRLLQGFLAGHAVSSGADQP